MTVNLSHPRANRRWALLGTIVMALSLVGVAVVQADLDDTLFELDKDGSAGNTFTNGAGLPGKIGVLNAAVAASPGPTAITICQDVSAFYDTAKVLINAERMTLADGSNGTGGGCPSGFSFKRNYNATRGVDGTTPGAHAKAEDVSRFAAATPASHDWNEVYASISADGNDEGDDDKCIALGAVECVFVHDGRAMSIFTQSKDYDEISDDEGATVFWKWRDQSVPDADELDDAFAIKFVDDSDEQHVFFGADRFATNGTKDAGFWFFHDEVTTGGPLIGTDGTFTGVHTAPVDGGEDGFCNPEEGGEGGPSDTPNCALYDDNDTGGDVLILTSFSQGGATVTARVFEWIGPAGSTAALLERSTSADCVPGPIASVCATVNNTTIESGTFGGGLWPYSGKSEPATNEIPSGGLLEGGINLTELGLEGCFSSFMATSRSSDSLTADPKDLILASFEACDTELTTTPKTGAGGALTADSDSDNLDEISIGTGLVTVKDSAVLNVKGTTTFTGSLSFYICGPIASPTACSSSGVLVNTINNVTANGTYVSNAVTLSSTGRYCWFGFFDSNTDGVPDASDGTIESAGPPKSTGECFEVTPVTPTLLTTAVEPLTLMSPTIYGSMADMNGSGDVTAADDSNAFYGDTSIIDGQLDCDAWTSDNEGALGDGTIDGDDDCTLIGYDGTSDGVEITVEDGDFTEADGVAIADGTPLPTVFNATTPDSSDIGDSDFAWSARFGRVDSNGNEEIGATDCSFDVIGTADILGSDAGCGFGTPIPAARDGYIDLNSDGAITTAADSCSGCFLGHDVANGLIQTGPVDFGQPVYDAATLTGTATQPGSGGAAPYPTINPAVPGALANGKITFTLVGPDGESTDCTTEATGTGTNPQDVTVSGDGYYLTLAFTPDAPDDYHWKAAYSGDPPPPGTPGTNTLGTSHNATCNETGEDVKVRQIPTEISTRQRVYPNDSARIASSEPTVNLPGGTVTFRLYVGTPASNGTPAMTALENCQAHGTTQGEGGLVYVETKTLTGDAATEIVATNNTTYPLTSLTAEAYWWVTYDPEDDAFTGIQSDCAESTSVTFVNDAGPGTLFTPPSS